MKNWYKTAKQNIENKIKDILLNNSFLQSVLNYYKIPKDDIKNELKITFKDLKGKFAEGNGREIVLDNKLLENDFFNQNFHFVIHEFFHWIKRRHEYYFYFNDTEEVQSFVLAMTWELISGRDIDEIKQNIYPIIKNHFDNEQDSQRIFDKMYEQSKKLFAIYQKNKCLKE